MRYPVSGKDAVWLENCTLCNDMTLHVSCDGLQNGNIKHCYTCGFETQIKGFNDTSIRNLINKAEVHWIKYPKYPYNWHKLSEKEKWAIIKNEREPEMSATKLTNFSLFLMFVAAFIMFFGIGMKCIPITLLALFIAFVAVVIKLK